jgi:hypothetical protein
MNSRLCISAPKLRTQHCIGSNEHIVGAEIGFGPGSPGAAKSEVATGSFDVRFAPDTVAKVENRSAPKISRKLIFGRLCRCVAFQRH